MSNFNSAANNDRADYSMREIRGQLVWLRGFISGICDNKEKAQSAQEYINGIYSELNEVDRAYEDLKFAFEELETKYDAIRP